jgi:short-subunit dehydrogenase
MCGCIGVGTGASSGIGREIAQLLAQRGARVFGTARNPKSAKPVPGVELIRMDVTDDAMRQAGYGRIVNISSMVGFIPAPFMGMYTASKHAVEGYTETLDHEVRQFGVRAVLVQPSYTESNINQNEKTAQTKLEAYAVHPQLVAEAVWRAVTAKSPDSVIPSARACS